MEKKLEELEKRVAKLEQLSTVALGLLRKWSEQRNNTTTTEPGKAPMCAVHKKPMHWQQSKNGPFWSCHERDEQNKFCTYRPPQNG